MMPLNSGNNSVGNQLVDKFLTLTITQYFLLGQWAAGKFKTGAFENSASTRWTGRVSEIASGLAS